MNRVYPEESISVHPPTIKIHLESIYDSPHYSLSVKCNFFYDKYKKIINFSLLILIICIVITITVLVNKTATEKNPCILYSDDEYASKISLECFQYMWLKGCKNTVPNDFNGGWWLRSPQGGQMVPCIDPNIGNRCGAGSFKTIRTYLFHCNLNYEGLN